MEYKIKKLISGKQLGYTHDNDFYVAIPGKHFSRTGNVVVEYDNQFQRFELDDSKLVRSMPDKFKKGETYNLVYFKWNKIIKI